MIRGDTTHCVASVTHGQGEAYEVEFLSLDGNTIGVETLEAVDLRQASGKAVPHERERLTAWSQEFSFRFNGPVHILHLIGLGTKSVIQKCPIFRHRLTGCELNPGTSGVAGLGD